MENRWPVIWVYHRQTHRRPTRHLSVPAACVTLSLCLLDHTCRCVQSLSCKQGSVARWSMQKPVKPCSPGIHANWGWHLANAPAFSRMGEYQHETSSCGLGLLPKHLSITFQCHTDGLVDHALELVLSGLVLCLVAIWLDFEFRSDCHLSGACVSQATSVGLYEGGA